MKGFSEGFLKDITNLIKLCVENETDNLEIKMPINGTNVKIEICFSVVEE